MKTKIAISGRRNIKDINYVREQLNKKTDQLIETHGKNNLIYISGMARGVDLIWANIARERDITLHAYVPCIDQPIKWFNAQDLRDYALCLLHASGWGEIHFTNLFKYDTRCMSLRNEEMINDCDQAIIVWDNKPTGGTYNFLLVCQKQDKKFEIIELR